MRKIQREKYEAPVMIIQPMVIIIGRSAHWESSDERLQVIAVNDHLDLPASVSALSYHYEDDGDDDDYDDIAHCCAIFLGHLGIEI